MIVNSFNFLQLSVAQVYFYNVMDYNKATYNKTLANFNTIDSRVNIDSIRAEDGDVAHIEIIKDSQVNKPS